MATIEFFYDFSSPYSYLASTQIQAVAVRAGAELVPRPFVLGAVFKAVGTDKIPASIPAKAAAMGHDLGAWARDYRIPFAFPDQFPVNSLKALRAVLAVSDPQRAWKLTERIFRAYWGENQDISQLDVLTALVAGEGLNSAEILAAIERPEIKERLRSNTDEAISRGAFGAPTMFVGDQMFLGNDRLHFVERAARGERIHG